MATSDIKVTLTAVDNVTPVLRRIRRELWWTQYGRDVALFVTGFVVSAVSFALGVVMS